jgi:hypothetical protein
VVTQSTLFKDVVGETMSKSSGNTDQGHAHEMLAVSWLLKNGYEAVYIPGQKKADVWIGYGKYLCRMNVKSSSELSHGMVCGKVCGGNRKKVKYDETDVDLIALYWTESFWPLFYHMLSIDKKHISAEPKMFTERNSLTTFESAFLKFKERKCR